VLAISAYAAVLLATVACVFFNDGAYRQLQASYNVKSETLEALKKRAATDLQTNGTTLMDLDTAVVAAPSETVAASALQRYLLERLQTAGGFVHSVQAEAKRETIPPGLQRLTAQLAFDASIVALQRYLFDLETGLPLVFVDALLAQPATQVRPGDRAGDRLRVTLTVTSYWKAGETAGAGQ
jgi:hypothetical protein